MAAKTRTKRPEAAQAPTSIKLPEHIGTKVRALLDQLAQQRNEVASYIRGAGEALGVPDGYRFDEHSMAFVEPPKE